MTIELKKQIRERLKTYKFRSSFAGSVVSTSGKLTVGMKSYGEKLVMELISDYKRKIYSTAMEKGTACEPESRGLIYRVFFPGEYIPDSQREIESEYFIGHIDIDRPNTIIDAKNSETDLTFAKAEPTDDNIWQMRTYLMGDKKTFGWVIYTLNDLPEPLLNRKLSKSYYDNGFDRNISWEANQDPRWLAIKDNIIKSETYPNLDDHDRIKPFRIDLTPEHCEHINKCAGLLRAYMQEFFEEFIGNSEKNRSLNLEA